MILITDEGKLCISDYKSIHKAILTVLLDGPQTMLSLVEGIRRRFEELKYTEVKYIVRAMGELIKQKLIETRY